MISVKEIRIEIKDGVEFVAKKYDDVRHINVFHYEHFLIFRDTQRVLNPPEKLTDEQIKMSVDQYVKNGRHEWFDHVKLSHYYQAWESLNA